MIEIIAHRGLWDNPHDMNTLKSFKAAIDEGFGIETDFRDRDNQLIISHDFDEKNPTESERLFNLFKNKSHTLAINIKSCGLNKLLKSKVNNLQNYFIFDLTIPEMLNFKKDGLKFYARISEFEPYSSIWQYASGFWVDPLLNDEWIDENFIKKISENRKSICFVSPELHGRDRHSLWSLLKQIDSRTDLNVQLCTDLPLTARQFFSEKN